MFRFFCFWVAIFVSSQFLAAAEKAPPVVLAHYMPWYSSKTVSGSWGWHWTMDHFDPDTGELASHDTPLIGAYDSSDPDALECQVLLMKMAGIDGVIIDWYGTEEFNDYADIHRNTKALIPLLKKAALKFAICYEDQSIGNRVKAGKLDAQLAMEKGKEAFAWMDKHWFGDESYLMQDGRPVVLVFGPQYFFEKAEWTEFRSSLTTNPLLFMLPHLSKKAGADGLFGWPPVTDGRTLSPAEWTQEIQSYYDRSESMIGVIFPGFHDIYEEAKLHESYGFIDDRGGKTFDETFKLALKSDADLIQIATWNDYGEGTVIEPTENHGYRYLEKLQRKLTAKTSNSEDLQLPVELYHLRKKFAGNSEVSADLERASQFLFAGNFEEAQVLLEAHRGYRTAKDILYREGDSLTDYMKERCRLDLYFPTEVKDFPTVVWFHGGGLSAGQRSISHQLKNQGIGVVAVNYRLSPKVESPAYIEDAAAAVAWTLKNIGSYGGNPKGVFVSGHSAGGYLASLVGLDKHWLAAHDIDADSIAGLIPFSGHTITHMTVRSERGIDRKQPVVDELAPLFHVRKDAPSTLLITGDREKEILGRYEEVAYFWRMMQVIEHPDTKLVELKGLDHGGMKEPAMPLLLEFIREHSVR